MSLTHFVIPFTPEQLDVVFKHLDMGAHREVRGLIDYIVAHVQDQKRQEQERQEAAANLTQPDEAKPVPAGDQTLVIGEFE